MKKSAIIEIESTCEVLNMEVWNMIETITCNSEMLSDPSFFGLCHGIYTAAREAVTFLNAHGNKEIAEKLTKSCDRLVLIADL